jgi:flagellar motor switch protein FliM
VVAGWAELDVGELRALRPGDVIALERPISEPLSVVVAAGRERAVCSARLGLINGRKAACLSATGSHGTR